MHRDDLFERPSQDGVKRSIAAACRSFANGSVSGDPPSRRTACR